MKRGGLLIEGKTKRVYLLASHKELVVVQSKNDITAGDGLKHDMLRDKAKLSTTTTSNVFKLLKSQKVPLAFKHKYTANTFLAVNCAMLPYEVIVRREAHGSYLKREPALKRGHRFDELLVEFFLKTKDKKYHGKPIPVDDPLIVMHGNESYLYLPNVPLEDQGGPFQVVDGVPQHWEKMSQIATTSFAILEAAWEKLGLKLVDFKVEFGIDSSNNLLLADVIDNDSWRLTDENGDYLDKQVYRDGGDMDLVESNYHRIAKATEQFCSVV